MSDAPHLGAGFNMTNDEAIQARIDSESLMRTINFACLLLLAVFVVFRLPQTITLFTNKEWIGSHFLHHVVRRPVLRRSVSSAIYSAYNYKDEKSSAPAASDGVYAVTSNSSDQLYDKSLPSTSPYATGPPMHMPATYFVKLRPLLHPLRRRVMPGFSVSQTIFVLAYSIAMLYATFYRSNIFTDTNRTGWIATSQLPFVFTMAQKNSAVGSLLGYGYEKLNYLHRYAGRVVVITTNIHTFHFVYRWVLDGTFTETVRSPHAMWGLTATCCINLIFFFSTAYWRQRAYNVFLVSHIAGFSLLLPALYLHKPATLPYIISALVLFSVDHIMRIFKTKVATAVIRTVPELDITRVEIRDINAGWRAGQHVRLRVLSTGMGPVGWAEQHPFTIASIAHSDEGLVLICKKAGDWTRRMYEMANETGHPSERGGGKEVKVMVEGPYGGTQRTLMASFSSAVFVAAGSGITFTLASIEDLIQKDLAGESRIKCIELLWVIRDPSQLTPMLPKLKDLIQSSVFTSLRINVFYTRAPTGKQPSFYNAITDAPYIGNAPSPSISPAHHEYFPHGLTLSPGRPRIAKFIEFAIQRAVAQSPASCTNCHANCHSLTGLVLGVCGPMALADDVAKAVSAVDPIMRDKVGGIEICEEVFGW